MAECGRVLIVTERQTTVNERPMSVAPRETLPRFRAPHGRPLTRLHSIPLSTDRKAGAVRA